MIWIKTLFITLIAALWYGGEEHVRVEELNYVSDGDQHVIVKLNQHGTDDRINLIVDGSDNEFLLDHMITGDVETHQLADGQELRIEKLDSGYRLELDGEDFHIGTASSHRIAIHEIAEHHQPTIRISGMGELDEVQKQAIIQSIRNLGIEREVRFVEASSEPFIWVDGDGSSGHRQVEIIGNNFVFDGDDQEGARVIVIDRKKQEIH